MKIIRNHLKTLLLIFLLCLFVPGIKANAYIETVNLCPGQSITNTYYNTFYSTQSITVDNTSYVNASITNQSIIFSTQMYYATDITFVGKSAGTSIVTLYYNGISLGSIEVIVSDHTMSEYTSQNDATCTEDGTKMAYCTKGCGYTDIITDENSALGHDEKDIPAVDPTCSKTGLTAGKYCARCNEILVSQNVIEKLPHTPEVLPAVSETCTTTGLTEGSKCSVCGEILKAQKTIDATGHKFSEWEIINNANAIASGSKTHKCSVCSTVETVEIPKLTPTIKLSKTKLTLKRKKTKTIKVSNLADGDYVKSWKSTKKKVAVVNSKGKIKAKKKGKTNIIVTLASGKTAVVKVTVK